MMEGEGRGKRLAATACAFTLLFCLAVDLGVHGAFQYQQVKQEQRLSAEYSLKQAQKAAAQPPSRRETEKSTATPEAKPPTATQESETEQESVLPISTTSAVTTADGALSEPAARREPSRIPAGLQNDHKVYLTFDDGPSQNTLEILRILKEHNAKATFFVVNSKYNAYMKRIVESGNAIALPRLKDWLALLGLETLRGEYLCYSLPVQREGWLLPEDEWEEIVDFLEREQLVCRASGGGWVLCRDLEHYSLHRLLGQSPWPLPRPAQLPERLDEVWYPALRNALEMLHEEQAALFGGSLAQWLRARE